MSSLSEEIIIDQKTGAIRQAGTSQGGQWIVEFKKTAEQSLYVFAKGILGLDRLTPSLHLPVSNWLQTCPPLRKLLMLPRDHLKTSLVVRAMPLHMVIQSKETNVYIPGKDGSSIRVLLAGETAPRHAEKQLGWIRRQAEGNERLRAFWPHRFWQNPERQSPMWNQSSLSFPRADDYPEPTIGTIGIGGAVTGSHWDVLVKDDLVTEEAANSTVMMQQAIEWHQLSRALLDSENSLEFVVGTKWANYDLYSEIIENDPSVQHEIRAAIEDGRPIFGPEPGEESKPWMFTLERIHQLQRELGGKFYLLYMNTATDPSLSEFDMEDMRYYTRKGQELYFEDDTRDMAIEGQDEPVPPPLPIGTPLNKDTYDLLQARVGYLRRARAA